MPSSLLEVKMVMDTAKRETKIMTKLFRLKRRKDETWVEYHTRTGVMAKKIRRQMTLPFLMKN